MVIWMASALFWSNSNCEVLADLRDETVLAHAN